MFIVIKFSYISLPFLSNKAIFQMSRRPSSDVHKFRKLFQSSKHVFVLTGAGVSAESGIPTFRGTGGFWRTYKAQELATPQAFARDPSLVWEFYHYRRELVLTKEPNQAHKALAETQKRSVALGQKITIFTQNIDGLHAKAGSLAGSLFELHGSLFQTRCTRCRRVAVNTDSPICPALKGKGTPDPSVKSSPIEPENLPRCDPCGGLLRPNVVWFNESLDQDILGRADRELAECDLMLVVGTSSVVQPAASFALEVASRGVPVAEFNLEETPVSQQFDFHFEGACGTTLPIALAPY